MSLPPRPCSCVYPTCQRPVTCSLREILAILDGQDEDVAGSQKPPDRLVTLRTVDSRSGNGAHVPLPDSPPDEDFLSGVTFWKGGS